MRALGPTEGAPPRRRGGGEPPPPSSGCPVASQSRGQPLSGSGGGDFDHLGEALCRGRIEPRDALETVPVPARKRRRRETRIVDRADVVGARRDPVQPVAPRDFDCGRDGIGLAVGPASTRSCRCTGHGIDSQEAPVVRAGAIVALRLCCASKTTPSRRSHRELTAGRARQGLTVKESGSASSRFQRFAVPPPPARGLGDAFSASGNPRRTHRVNRGHLPFPFQIPSQTAKKPPST